MVNDLQDTARKGREKKGERGLTTGVKEFLRGLPSPFSPFSRAPFFSSPQLTGGG